MPRSNARTSSTTIARRRRSQPKRPPPAAEEVSDDDQAAATLRRLLRSSVHIPAFKGAHTQGETIEECLADAREVIELHAEVMAERGEPRYLLQWQQR
jgi:hypothetical protein